MTGQERQKNQVGIYKKMPHLASRIIWLAWIGFLLLLTAVALVFRVPWKLMALVIVFLLAATILPGVYRKWFWAGVGCVVAVMVIWIFLPEETEGWRPYTFDKELAALEAKLAVPDIDNAAIIYNQLLTDYDEIWSEARFIDPNLQDCIGAEPWHSAVCPEMARWLEQEEKTISMLIEASRMEQCRFPIDADVERIAYVKHRLMPMERLVRILNWSANNDIAEGRTEAGLEKYITTLQMGRHQNQQPTLLDFMVGTGIELRSTSLLKRFVVTGDATEEHLILIEKALAGIKHDWGYDLPIILDYEKLLAKNIWGMFYEVNPQGKIRFARRSVNDIGRFLFEKARRKSAVTYWNRRFIKVSAILFWFCLPSAPQETGEVVDSIYERCYAMARPDFDWYRWPETFSFDSIRFNCRYMTEMLLSIREPVYYSIHETHLRAVAQQRGSRLIIALRRYKNKNGCWPESLDEIQSSAPEEIFVDPMNGGSFVYKLINENFILYSKGRNGIDNGGRRDDWYEMNGADDLLIWLVRGSGTGQERI